MTDRKRLLATYPRRRNPLPEEYRGRFVDDYRANREGRGGVGGIARRLEGWMHRRIAARSGDPVLEIGAGTLNHLEFEPRQGRYDAVEPFTELYAEAANRRRLRNIYRDIADIPESERYARIVSIAALEHIPDLPEVLARSGLLLAGGGVFQAGIPSEGGFLWGAAWRCSTGLSYRLRTGLDYGVVMRHEHLSRADEIIALVRWFFADVKLARFPLPFHHLSFYAYIEACTPDVLRCRDALQPHAAR